MTLLRRIQLLFLPCLFLITNGTAQSTATERDQAFLRMLQKQVDSLYHTFDKAADPVRLLTVRVEHRNESHWSAAMGVITDQLEDERKQLSVTMRVGTEWVDNFSPIDGRQPDKARAIKVYDIPLDGNERAVRQVLAMAVQEAYQEGRARYHRALAAHQSHQVPPQGDFAIEPSVAYFEPPLNIELHTDVIRHSLATATGALEHPDSALCSAELQFLLDRKYLVNSEGTAIAEDNSRTTLIVTLSGTAVDNTPLTLHKNYYCTTPHELPLSEDLSRDVQNMESTMMQMRHSQRGSASVCPVLFEDEAAPVFWQYAFTPVLLNPNTPVNSVVAPVHWQVVSAPAETSYNNQKLFGSYFYDDEGKEGERLLLVDDGQLIAVPYAANSSRQFHHSNGHGRAALDRTPMPMPSNLLVSTTAPLSQTTLRQYFKQSLTAQEAEFGYRVTAAIISDGNIRPEEVWKIYADNRPDEMVHGIELHGTPRMLLTQLGGGGDKGACTAFMENGVPYHCCAPATWVKMMEVEVEPASASEAITIPKTAGETVAAEETDSEAEPSPLLWAMKDDMRHTLSTFKNKDIPDPYYVRHLVTDAQVHCVTSSLGSTVSTRSYPIKEVETKMLVGTDRLNNDNVSAPDEDIRAPLSIYNDYWYLRQVFGNQSKTAYRQAARQYAEKEQQLRLLPDSVRLALPPDRVANPAAQSSTVSLLEPTDPAKLVNFANEISSLFERYDFLTNSGVELYDIQGKVSFAASDGTLYHQPINLLRIRIFAETMAADGTVLRDRTDVFLPHLDNENLAKISGNTVNADWKRHTVNRMAQRLKELRTAPEMSETYDGPVLLMGEAVADLFAYACAEVQPNLIATHPQVVLHPDDNKTILTQPATLDSQIDHVIASKLMDVDAYNTKSAYHQKIQNGESNSSYEIETPLAGAFATDAEGAVSEPHWEIIRRGELITLLSTQVPTEGVRKSNGHARLALRNGHVTIEPGPGVLEMTCHRTIGKDQLMKLLCKQARSAKQRHAYIILKTITENGVCKPFHVLRIDANTGKTTPVRIDKPIEFNLLDYKYLEAASQDKSACNRMVDSQSDTTLDGIPCSFIVPDIILLSKFKLLNINK
ncbi:MAG: hypothetical protein J5730_00770 [Bacteroidales bacterium]|nr:hypothetical protein [Bacteroidales bacterium]